MEKNIREVISNNKYYFTGVIQMKAIVFTSNTGTTEKYARLLADKTGLPAYSSEQARRELADGSESI